MSYLYLRLAAFYHAARLPTLCSCNPSCAWTRQREGLLPNLTDIWAMRTYPPTVVGLRPIQA